MSSPDATNINPKDCIYRCNTKIYWNNGINEYWELITNKKHICPNRSTSNKSSATSRVTSTINNNNNKTAPKPTYHNNNYRNNYNNNYNCRKSWTPNLNNKKPMDNSLEILQGSSVETIRKQYEVLADLIKDLQR